MVLVVGPSLLTQKILIFESVGDVWCQKKAKKYFVAIIGRIKERPGFVTSDRRLSKYSIQLCKGPYWKFGPRCDGNDIEFKL